VFLFNQTAQIGQSAKGVKPRFGEGVVWGLIFLYAALLLAPFVLWFKVPMRKSPPATLEGPEYGPVYDRFPEAPIANRPVSAVSA
jgi:hypothetical protein